MAHPPIIRIHWLCFRATIGTIDVVFQDKAGTEIDGDLGSPEERYCGEIDTDGNDSYARVRRSLVDTILEKSHFVVFWIHFVKFDKATNDVPRREGIGAIALVTKPVMDPGTYKQFMKKKKISSHHRHCRKQMNLNHIRQELEAHQSESTNQHAHMKHDYRTDSFRTHNNIVHDETHELLESFDILPTKS